MTAHHNGVVPGDTVVAYRDRKGVAAMMDEDEPFAADTSGAFGTGLTGRPRGMRHPLPDKDAEPAWLTREPLLEPQEIVARMQELDPDAAKELLDREQAKREARRPKA